MAESRRLALAQAESQKANAEVMKQYIPQLFTSQKVMMHDGEETTVADNDEWKLTNSNPAIFFATLGFKMIAIETKNKLIEEFIDYSNRGLIGIAGGGRKDAVNITSSLGGGGRGKVVKKRGFVQRHITQRGKGDYEEVDTNEVE